MSVLFVAFKRQDYSRLRAWMETRRSRYMVEGHEIVIPDHWWRKQHNEHAWGYYAIFAPHPDGPDTQINYRGEEEHGFQLEEPGWP